MYICLLYFSFDENFVKNNVLRFKDRMRDRQRTTNELIATLLGTIVVYLS